MREYIQLSAQIEKILELINTSMLRYRNVEEKSCCFYELLLFLIFMQSPEPGTVTSTVYEAARPQKVWCVCVFEWVVFVLKLTG